jgi:hypothetical protein
MIIKLLNQIVATVPQEFFVDDGSAFYSHSINGRFSDKAMADTNFNHYVYVWFHDETPIYVGKGTGSRFSDFRKSPHYRDGMVCYFACSCITETASFAVEYTLINHFGMRSQGGILVNDKPGSLPKFPRFLFKRWLHDEYTNYFTKRAEPVPENYLKVIRMFGGRYYDHLLKRE